MYAYTINAVETVSGIELRLSLSEVTGPSGGGRKGTVGYTRTVPWSEVPDHEAGFPGWVAEVASAAAHRLRAS
jgi:hypothetical protein